MGLGPSQEKPRTQSGIPTSGPSQAENGINHQSPANANTNARPYPIHSDDEINIDLILSPPASANALSASVAPKDPHPPIGTVPTTFNWLQGGGQVLISGTFNGWSATPLNKQNDGSFSGVQNLVPGVYQYKFIVDGRWRPAHDQPTTLDPDGNVNNYIDIKAPPKGDLVVAASPPGEYSFEVPMDDYAKEPPGLPPHLYKAWLSETPSEEDPSLLPLPPHVVINHVYSCIHGEEVVILGATHRHKDKFVTTVFYKPIRKRS